MSKKLIAVASAAALALSALVGVAPAASAGVGPFAVVADGDSAAASVAGTLSTTPSKINVPSANVLRYNSAEVHTTGTLIRYDITTPGATDITTVTSTGSVKLITATQLAAATAPVVADGTTSASVTSVGGDGHIYALTTSTGTGTVVFSSGGSSATRHLAGQSNFAYKLELTAPSIAALGGEFTISGKIKDAFGNDLTAPLETASAGDFTMTGIVGATHVAADFSYTAATKVYEFVFTAPTTATGTAIQIKLAPEHTSTKVTAFGTPVSAQFFTVSAVDLSAQVTALTAQVAALTADYNALAAKWNARVASKKAPKKAVATK
jgi:hypothetical protein